MSLDKENIENRIEEDDFSMLKDLASIKDSTKEDTTLSEMAPTDYSILRSIHSLMEFDSKMGEHMSGVSEQEYRKTVKQLLQQLLVKMMESFETTKDLENRVGILQKEKRRQEEAHLKEVNRYQEEVKELKFRNAQLKQQRESELKRILEMNENLIKRLKELNQNFVSDEKSDESGSCVDSLNLEDL